MIDSKTMKPPRTRLDFFGCVEGFFPGISLLYTKTPPGSETRGRTDEICIRD